MRLRLGTRRSALALAQAQTAAQHFDCEVEIVEIGSAADDKPTVPIHELGGREAFTSRLTNAVTTGEVDAAVHSLKDLAPAETTVVPLERSDPADCLVGASTLEELRPGATIGTSSERRRLQLLGVRPDLTTVAMRGNVGTRVARVGDSVDAVILAVAGLTRLGLEYGTRLDPEVFVPAPGQGTIAIEFTDPKVGDVLHGRDPVLEQTTRLERDAAIVLGGSCDNAVGAWSPEPSQLVVWTPGTGARMLTGSWDRIEAELGRISSEQ